ncbi:fasciclin domain-containing protein [Deinococcus peraridilitoris]|uniref:Secreted/surface protein with fasciclin-like repeats n=1 Tax=Deinococcus peraridilitoris (strain DSM 19664 / LMG 22246 / CIP 109416 / KR-200) TaxID=937777 RepID=K9ZYZ7_DEIPD|nr:fasciclin domain-containing protein [Deinococcus peraridilitoris]AFZ66122.1 secreted/surface protein with fasciclin-like repeats [Deinococcus peraridilitoris DSM 19664]
MKKTVLLALTSSLALGAVALAGGGGAVSGGGTTQAACSSITELVALDPQFSTLLGALNQAELLDTFRGGGPFTVFAPTNAAFAKVPQDQLQMLMNDRAALTRVLQHHVVQGRVTGRQAAQLSGANALSGERLSISTSSGMVMVAGANVTRADITACNGVIHVIDTVLMPTGTMAMGNTTQANQTTTQATGTQATGTQTGTAAGGSSVSTGITAAQIPATPLSGSASGTAGSTTTDTATTGTGTAATGTTSTTGTTTTGTTSTTGTASTTGTGTAATGTTTTGTTTQTQGGAGDVDPNTALPNSITKVIQKDPRLSTLAAALKAGALEKAFDTAGEYTFFAPTNEAFAKIPQAQRDALLANPDALFQVLMYHVVPMRTTAAQASTLQGAVTLQGAPLSVNVSGSTVKVGNASVVATDVQADNGVIHLIDTVLLPPGFTLPQ